MNQQNLSSFIWSVADLLRGDYKQSEYGKVILPFTVLRRLDCVLEPTKAAVLKEKEKREKAKLNPEPFLLKKSKQLFYNTSPLDMKKLMGDQDNIAENMFSYIQAFSSDVRDVFECFDFHIQVDRLSRANLLYLVSEKFAGNLLQERSERSLSRSAPTSNEFIRMGRSVGLRRTRYSSATNSIGSSWIGPICS
jgi:type I restriction enzyme M protein